MQATQMAEFADWCQSSVSGFRGFLMAGRFPLTIDSRMLKN